MTHELTHASFFSGVGGVDLGLERAGWRTVSFSEIDPYACAVLAERWPGVPNLGSITDLARGREGVGSGEQHGQHADGVRVADGRRIGQPAVGAGVRARGAVPGARRAEAVGRNASPGRPDWHDAVLWTGGFPCQDLSVAGKRRGMGTHADRLDTRSGLAYAFLDLVERHRPPAIVLENVPGLLSSNGGRDLGALLGRLGELGYWWAYRVLDARHFGVPQRRRRVFIVAIHARVDPAGDGPAEVLSVGSRCDRHPAAGVKAGEGTPDGADDGATAALTSSGSAGQVGHNGGDEHIALIGAVTGRPYDDRGDDLTRIVGASPDAGRVRAADGLAGRTHDHELAHTLTAPEARHRVVDGKRQDGSRRDRIPHVVVNALDQRRGGADDNEAQAGHLVMGTLREHVRPGSNTDFTVLVPTDTGNDPLLPDGLDSHRYRCCGNGVVADVAEWLGQRLAGYFA